MSANQVSDLPVKSWKFWGILLSLFAIVLIFTAIKDGWLTLEEPNILFYLFVPILSILGGVLSVYGIVKIIKNAIPFLALFAISIAVNTVMQVVEIVSKITYYRIWQYPGFLYIVLVIPLGFLLMIYGLVRWGKVKFWTAVLLSAVDFVGSMVVVIFLTEGIGLTTPGS